jgi:cell division protein FtsL
MKPKYSAKKKLRTKAQKSKVVQFFHYVKFYILVLMICTAVITIPLALVWKQAYITSVSLKYDSLKDSTAVLQKEIVALNLALKQLSSTERIESIARKSLKLDYPSSEEIVIVYSEKKKRIRFLPNSPFWAVLKKSIELEKG